MYKDYLDAILEHYEQKRVNSELSPRLLNPTPSKLREECVFVYQTRFEVKDLPMLRLFFGVAENSDMPKAIERFDIDKFRPLVNYLKKATDNTDDKNIELLGWLLDFAKRPYDAAFKYGGNNILASVNTDSDDVEEPVTEIEDVDGANESGSEGSSVISKLQAVTQRGYKWMDKRRLPLRVGSVAVLSVIFAFYFSNKADVFGNGISARNECMIWTGDQYEQVSCDSPRIAGLPIPLDKIRQQNLHRITMPDTITEKYIGNIWYRKRGSDSIDLYTAGGRDPVNLNQDLKRMSFYIFDKYLRKNISLK